MWTFAARRVRGLTAGLIGICLSVPCAAQPPQQTAAPSPAIQQSVAQIAAEYFATQKGFKSGDMVTKTHAQALLALLQKLKWTVDVKESAKLLERVPPPDDFLVQQLTTEKGRQLLNKIRSMPGGIDRLDRIAGMPQGKANVEALVNKVPNGDQWIAGLTTTERGLSIGRRLSKAPHGKDFNKKTGRIYTQQDLITAISRIVTPPPEPTDPPSP